MGPGVRWGTYGGQQRVSGLLELELEVVVSPLTWCLPSTGITFLVMSIEASVCFGEAHSFSFII